MRTNVYGISWGWGGCWYVLFYFGEPAWPHHAYHFVQHGEARLLRKRGRTRRVGGAERERETVTVRVLALGWSPSVSFSRPSRKVLQSGQPVHRGGGCGACTPLFASPPNSSLHSATTTLLNYFLFLSLHNTHTHTQFRFYICIDSLNYGSQDLSRTCCAPMHRQCGEATQPVCVREMAPGVAKATAIFCIRCMYVLAGSTWNWGGWGTNATIQ